MLEKYRAFVEQNKELTPNFSFVPISEIQNRFQYVGGQIANGKLYAIINSSEKMLTCDLRSGEMDFLGSYAKNDFKWTGGCLYQDMIVMFPRFENTLLIYHIESKTFEEIDCGLHYTAEHHYGGVCTHNGIIYQPPRSTNHILKWDLNEKVCKKIEINAGQVCRYCGSVIHPNGYIYFIPERNCRVLKMNMETEEIVPIGDPICAMAFDPTIAFNGNIYGYSTEKGILKIDTENDTVSMICEELETHAYGTKCGINGNLYSLPGYTNDVWEFDPQCEALRKCYSFDAQNKVNYAGGAVDINGDIYGLPVWADNILKISFQKHNVTIPSDIYSLFYKDFY